MPLLSLFAGICLLCALVGGYVLVVCPEEDGQKRRRYEEEECARVSVLRVVVWLKEQVTRVTQVQVNVTGWTMN